MPQPDYMTAGRSERPTGISILSVLHIISGISGLALFAFLLSRLNDPRMREGLDAIGIPFSLFVFVVGFLSLLILASGIGMRRSAKWGWYLGSFLYTYSIVTDVNALFTIGDILSTFPIEEAAKATHSAGYYYVKFGIRLVLGVLIYLYFFKQIVRTYFGLQNTKKWPAVAIQFAVCIGIGIAFAIWANVGH